MILFKISQTLMMNIIDLQIRHQIFHDLSKTFEPRHEKTNNVDFDQVWHNQGFTATGDG